MTLQTPAPLQDLATTSSHRRLSWFESLRSDNDINEDPLKGGLELNAPYQRGNVWSTDQQRLLIKSFLLGIPVPAIVINSRYDAHFTHTDGSPDWRYAVVDGKQRVTAILAWLSSELDIPASWLSPTLCEATHETPDGDYVFVDELSSVGRRFVDSSLDGPVVEARLPTLAAEAAVYLLLNNSGIDHTDDDLARAAAFAG